MASLLIFAAALATTPSRAAVIAYEGFDYAAGVSLNGRSGGIGWQSAQAWTGPNAVQIASPGQSFPGLVGLGNSVRCQGNLALVRTLTSAGFAELRSGGRFGLDGTEVWLSFLARRETAFSASDFGGLSLLDAGVPMLLVGCPAGSSTWGFQLFEPGGVPGTITPAPTAPVVTGRTVLLVLRLQFGVNGVEDRVDLFVNPTPGVIPPVPDATRTGADFRFDGIRLQVGSAPGAAMNFDEIRLGTTFGSVTPVPPDFQLRIPLSGAATEHLEVTRQIETVNPLPPGRTLTFELVGETFGATLNPTTGLFSWVPGELEGNQRRTFTIRATSNANPPASATTSFFLDVAEGNRPPVLDPVADQEVTEGASWSYQLVATDSDLPAQRLSYSVLTGPAGLAVSTTGLLTFTPTIDQAGRSYPVTVLVNDTLAGRAQQSFNLMANARALRFARWIGVADGDWNNPSNWDIGRVPNNTATEAFEVIWDAHPVTVRVPGEVTVRRFRFSSGGTLELTSAASHLALQTSFFWNAGTLAGQGRMTVPGDATLVYGGREPFLTLRDQCRLHLRGRCELGTTLRFAGDTTLVLEPTATLGVPEYCGFERVSGVPELRNEGSLYFWGAARSIPCIFLRNRGTVTAYASTIDFQTGSDTDLVQESGGRLSVGAGLGDRATIQGTVLIQTGSTLSGEAHIRSGHVNGTLQGRLSFDRLVLGPTAVCRLGVSANPDRLTVQASLVLAGRLELAPLGGFVPGVDATFTLVSSPGGITGEFAGTPIGQRIQLPLGGGSFQLDRTDNARSVVLSRYLPMPMHLGGFPLDFRLPEGGETSGGCHLLPHPAVTLGAGSLGGARLVAEISAGFDAVHDRLEWRPHPRFSPGDEVVFVGPPAGVQTASYRGTVFGTVQLEPRRLTAELNAAAGEEAVVALLGGLFYRNTELSSNWYRQGTDQYPQRTVDITLTDGTGLENRISRAVNFPVLWGLEIREAPPEFVVDGQVYLPENRTALLRVFGTFSTGQVQPVPFLNLAWTESCNPGVLAGEVAGRPGERSVKGLKAPYCCTVYASAGPIGARVRIYDGEKVFAPLDGSLLPGLLGLVRVTPIELASTMAFNPHCPLGAMLFNYVIPECEVTPGGRAQLQADSGALRPSPVTYYSLRALMRESPAGRRLAGLYEAHGEEVVRLLAAHPALFWKAQELMAAFDPGVRALLAGRGNEVTITPGMVAMVEAFWDSLARFGSPGLQATLEAERVRFDAFRRFQGGSFSHWAGLLGVPVPTRAWLHLSLMRREGNRFQFAVNDLPGVEWSVARSVNLVSWEPVPNAEVLRDGVNVLVTDPACPDSQAFYRISP